MLLPTAHDHNQKCGLLIRPLIRPEGCNFPPLRLPSAELISNEASRYLFISSNTGTSFGVGPAPVPWPPHAAAPPTPQLSPHRDSPCVLLGKLFLQEH